MFQVAEEAAAGEEQEGESRTPVAALWRTTSQSLKLFRKVKGTNITVLGVPLASILTLPQPLSNALDSFLQAIIYIP